MNACNPRRAPQLLLRADPGVFRGVVYLHTAAVAGAEQSRPDAHGSEGVIHRASAAGDISAAQLHTHGPVRDLHAYLYSICLSSRPAYNSKLRALHAFKSSFCSLHLEQSVLITPDRPWRTTQTNYISKNCLPLVATVCVACQASPE